MICEFQKTLLQVICEKTKLIHESWFLLIMDRELHYDTQRSIVILLAERIWGGNLSDFSIKNTYRTTTLMYFKYIWKIHLVYNIQIHKFCESANSQYCYFKLVQWKCHIFIEFNTFLKNVLLGILQVFVKHLFLWTPLWDCFCKPNNWCQKWYMKALNGRCNI